MSMFTEKISMAMKSLMAAPYGAAVHFRPFNPLLTHHKTSLKNQQFIKLNKIFAKQKQIHEAEVLI